MEIELFKAINKYQSILPSIYKYKWLSKRLISVSLWRKRPAYMQTREYVLACQQGRQKDYFPWQCEASHWKKEFEAAGFTDVIVFPASNWITIRLKFPQEMNREYSVNRDWIIANCEVREANELHYEYHKEYE